MKEEASAQCLVQPNTQETRVISGGDDGDEDDDGEKVRRKKTR